MIENKWTRKDLLGLRDLEAREIFMILDTAKSFEEVSLRTVKKVPALRGRTVANLFFEPSTRTRISFWTRLSEPGSRSLDSRGPRRSGTPSILASVSSILS